MLFDGARKLYATLDRVEYIKARAAQIPGHIGSRPDTSDS